MDIICSKELLKNSVMQLEKIVCKNPTLPVLSCLLLNAQNNKLILRATNLDVGVEVEIKATVKKNGIVAVPASIFARLLMAIPAEEKEIKIKEKGGNIECISMTSTTLIKCLPTEEFPTIPLISEGKNISLKAQDITKGISSVIYAASTSDIKPELSSVYVYTEDNNIIFTSTDAFRLAEKRIKIKNDNQINGIIIPFKNAAEIIRVIGEHEGDIDMRFTGNQMSCSTDSIYITSRVIDGVFPDYKQIIPREKTTEVIALKQDILNALKMSGIFSNKFHQITITVTPNEKKMNIDTQNGDAGESMFFVDAAISGEDIIININQKYIMDCLPYISGDSVSISLSGSNKPVILSGVGDNSFRYLIMPMNK